MNLHGIEIDSQLYKHFLEFLTDGEIDALFKAIKTPPPRYYLRVNTAKTTPGDLIRILGKRGISVYRDEHVEEAIWAPVQGPYKIPTAKKLVVADKKAAESVMLGADLYAPGVLKTDEVRSGEEVNVIADDGTVVAYGVAVADSDYVLKTRRGLYIKVEKSLYKTPKIRDLPEYKEGLIYSQSLPAIAVGYVIRKLGVSKVVDLNAAPGGKCTHAAQFKIWTIAVDRSWPKINRLGEEVQRLGLDMYVDILLHDSRYLDRDFPRLKAGLAIVDPPCTDLGVRPKIYHKVSFNTAKTLSQYQIQFLKTALKIADYVVYSTCTLTYIENEEVLRKTKATPIDIDLPIGSPGWGCAECRRFLPHVHNTPGFFLALVKKET
ncbi:MAG: RsmB/NOP family class I SAM-dependent RNA methyltransferase [Pyrobaculum sp.]